MKELHMGLEHSIFVQSHSRVRRLARHILKKRVNGDPLNELAMTLECLHFRKLILCDTPQDRGTIKRAGNDVLRVT